MERETFLNLIPAYALGALDDDERAVFESHLADDPDGQKLLAEYQALADNLILATPARQAPAHLGADLQQRLKAQATPAKRLSPIWRRWLAVAAVLALVIGAVFGLIQLQKPPAAEQLYAELSSLDGAARMSLTARENFEGVRGQMIVHRYSNRAVIHVYGLPPLAEDQTYQLWLAGPDGVVSGGLFQSLPPDTATNIVLPLAVTFDDYTGFGVSLEPGGGSPFPDRRSGPGVFGVSLDDA